MPKSAVEKELLKVSGFEPKKDYKDRQDYLAALARAVQDISDKEFDSLSNEAADWHGDAVDAINAGNDLPDFPDAEPDEKPARSRKKAAEPEVTEDDGETEDGEAEDEAEDEDEAEEEPEKPARSRKSQPSAKPGAKGNGKQKPEPKKAAKSRKAEAEDDGEAEDEPAPKKSSSKPVKRSADPEAGITLDRYGIAEGTKNAQAVAMLEKGAKMSDVNSEIGGTYYNLLKRLTKQGHNLLREPGGMLRLVHKDDAGKPAKGGKGKK